MTLQKMLLLIIHFFLTLGCKEYESALSFSIDIQISCY